MDESDLEELKVSLRCICNKHSDRFDRSRRLFLEERAVVFKNDREVEYAIKKEVSEFFDIRYSSITFAGSAQIGYSIHKNKLFIRRESDLDIACVDSELFQVAWMDILKKTKAFTDETVFSGLTMSDINAFKDSLLRRGMIRIELMPRSIRSLEWKRFEESISRKYVDFFNGISIAIYINEYAFCWKQDSILTRIMRD